MESMSASMFSCRIDDEFLMEGLENFTSKPDDDNNMGAEAAIGAQYSDNLNPTKVGLEDFDFKKNLGKGGYGKVLLVEKKTGPDCGEIYAIKVLRKDQIYKNLKDIAHMVTERRILQLIDHPFLVKFKYAFQTPERLNLVMEFLAGGEMFKLLEDHSSLNASASRFYLAEITLALEYLHSLKIIYRDLKPENIMFDREGHVKLTDFGLCKEFMKPEDKTHTFCGTLEYMAPEIIDREDGHSKDVDWWSLGALAFDMLVGQPPFSDNNRLKLQRKIRQGKVRIPDFVDHDAKDLIRKLLRTKVETRLGFGVRDGAQIREHYFFKSMCWEKVYLRQYQPPLLPELKHKSDVSRFDPAFTTAAIAQTPIKNWLSHSFDEHFINFDYVHPSFLLETQELPAEKEECFQGNAISQPIAIPKRKHH